MSGTADPRDNESLDELSAAIDDWIADLTVLSTTLQEMQATMLPVDFEGWMLAAGLDPAAVEDFVAFDGDLRSVTDRMLAALQRVVSALN